MTPELTHRSLVLRQPSPSRASVKIAITAVVALILVQPREASAGQCPEPRNVSIRITPVRGPVSRNEDVSLAQIRRLAGAQNAAKHFPLLGMYVGTVALNFTVNEDFNRLADGGICAVSNEIEVHAGYVDRTVFIAREARNDQCVSREILEHDLRHARMDDAAMEAFIPLLSRRVAAAMRSLVGIPAQDKHRAENALKLKINALLASMIDTLENIRLDMHGSLDSDAELARLRESCHGRGQNLQPQGPSEGPSETHSRGRV